MRYKIQNAFTHIGRTVFSNLLSLIALGFFTLLLSTFLFNHGSVYKELELKETAPQFIAYLNDTVVEDDAKVFANQIEKKEHIFDIYYISKEENYNRADRQFGLLGQFIKNKLSDSNPFPAFLEIYLKSTDVSRKTLEEIAFDIESYAEIDDIKLTGYGIITDLFRQISRMTIASICIIIFISFLVIRAAVLKTAQTRHAEIYLLDLIGATRGHLKIPFLIQGIFLGLFGTHLGIACFYLLYCLFTFQLGLFEFIPFYQLITVVVSGMIIGLFAGIFAQRKYFKLFRKTL